MRAGQAAPGELELVRAFVNTLDVEHATDELGEDGARAWLLAHGLGSPEEPLEAEDRRRLLALREAVRELLVANNSGAPPPPAALATLNEQSTQAALGLRFDPGGAALVSACEGVDAAIARLLALIHDAMRDDTWPRLKVCPADDCRWAFYDHSRNRSGTWCSMEECGNRAKARSYRERHRPQGKR